MKRLIVAVAVSLAFVSGVLFGTEFQGDVEHGTMTRVITETDGGIRTYSFTNVGMHTWAPTPDVQITVVTSPTTRRVVPDPEPESEPIKAKDAIDWAFFTLLALACIVVAGSIVFVIVGLVCVMWIDRPKS